MSDVNLTLVDSAQAGGDEMISYRSHSIPWWTEFDRLPRRCLFVATEQAAWNELPHVVYGVAENSKLEWLCVGNSGVGDCPVGASFRRAECDGNHND